MSKKLQITLPDEAMRLLEMMSDREKIRPSVLASACIQRMLANAQHVLQGEPDLKSEVNKTAKYEKITRDAISKAYRDGDWRCE